MTIPIPPHARPAVLSALLALALYAITLGGTYVYDDRYIVLADPRVEEVSRWGEFWTKDYFNGGPDNLYRPLVSMTYAVQVWLHGRSERSAWAFHAVNWLLHAAASAAVAEFARRASKSFALALAAGLLFAAHPIHVEAVANIIGRAEIMCAVAALGALILFIRPLTSARVLAIWACVVVAILSKEQGLLVPLMLVLAVPLRPPGQLDPHPTDPPQRGRFSRASLLLIVLMCWTLAAYIVFRESILRFWWDRSFLDRTINPMIASEGTDRVLMPLVLLGRYVALLVAPLRLSPDYGGDAIGATVNLADPYLYLGACAALAGVVACAVAYRRRAWLTLYCLLCFALLFGMVGNVVSLIGTIFGERLMYLPSIFFCILAGVAFIKLPRRLAAMSLTIVLLLFSVRTVTYAARWNQPARLFRTAIAEQPKTIQLYLLLAEEQDRTGDLDGAIATLKTARDVAPTYYRVWLNSGHLAMKAGHYQEALRFAQRAQQLAPTREGERLAQKAADEVDRATTTAPSS